MEPVKDYFDITRTKDKLIYTSEAQDVRIEFTRKFKHSHPLPASLSESVGYEHLKAEGWYTELLVSGDECFRIVSETEWVALCPKDLCDKSDELREIYRDWIEEPFALNDDDVSHYCNISTWTMDVPPKTPSQKFYYERTGKSLMNFTIVRDTLILRFDECGKTVNVIYSAPNMSYDIDQLPRLRIKLTKYVNIVKLIKLSDRLPISKYGEPAIDYAKRLLRELELRYTVIEDTLTEHSKVVRREFLVKRKLGQSRNVSAKVVAGKYFDYFKDYEIDIDWCDVVRVIKPNGDIISVTQDRDLNVIDRLFRDHPTIEDSFSDLESDNCDGTTFSDTGYIYTAHILRK